MNLKASITACAILSASAISSFAQSASKANPSPYVFPEFIKGTVMQKGGGIAEAVMDYNIVTQEMMFDKDGQKLVLDADNVDTIYIANRKFVPARSVYFEKLTDGATPLYVQYKAKAVLGSSKSGGGDNNAVLGMNGTQKKGDLKQLTSYDLHLPDGYTIKNETEYWLQKKNSFSQAGDIKKITKQFPDKEAQITAFIKENNIDISKQADLIKLINFCNK